MEKITTGDYARLLLSLAMWVCAGCAGLAATIWLLGSPSLNTERTVTGAGVWLAAAADLFAVTALIVPGVARKTPLLVLLACVPLLLLMIVVDAFAHIGHI